MRLRSFILIHLVALGGGALCGVSRSEAVTCFPVVETAGNLTRAIDPNTQFIDRSQVEAVPGANEFLDTMERPSVVEDGPPESQAIQRAGIILESETRLRALPGATDDKLILQQIGKGRRYGGRVYQEFPNSTMLSSVDPVTGKPREFLLTRGIRRYETEVSLKTGEIGTRNYVSDVLLFEIVNGKAIYRNRTLNSRPETKFLFEDPRVSTLRDRQGKKHYILSGTDYSPHVTGSSDPDVMNRFVELELDERGVPRPVVVDQSGRPVFANLSPPPHRVKGGGYEFVDAKNAVISQNDAGEVVVRTRFRSFKDARGKLHKYGEQIFVFKNYDEFRAYDWSNAIRDLSEMRELSSRPSRRTRPKVAKILLEDHELKEQFKGLRVMAEKGKGLGPGAPPFRVVRRKGEIWASSAWGEPEMYVGRIQPGSHIALKEGESTYIAFDHEIRYVSDQRGVNNARKRHYSVAVKQFDSTLTNLKAYFADAIQPKTPHEVGYRSGIADLHHVYIMGRSLFISKDRQARVMLSAGVSDAHTEMFEVDIMKLLEEMSSGSDQFNSGQVYIPKAVRNGILPAHSSSQ